MTTNAIPAPTAFLIRSVGGHYFVGASQGWHSDPQWAFECETRADAERLAALTDRKTSVVTRAHANAVKNGVWRARQRQARLGEQLRLAVQ